MSRTSTGSSSRREPRPGHSPGEPPIGAAEIAAALAEIGLRPSRGLGQSFLADPFVADAEAALVEVAPGQPVLEIGGGLGALTAALLRRGYDPLTVLERDPRLAAHLLRTFGRRIRLVTGDAETIALPSAQAVVGNLPFSVATPILLRLFAARTPRVVALVQKEVAERLAAGPGSKCFGRLSIIAALYGEVELFQVVPRRSFVPTPEVDGQIVVYRSREGPLPVRSPALLEDTVRWLFSARRKQLKNLLPRATPPGISPGTLAADAGWPEDWERLRPENLPPSAYFALANRLSDVAGQRSSPRGRHV